MISQHLPITGRFRVINCVTEPKLCRAEKIPVSGQFCPGNRDFLRHRLFIESRIGKVDVLLIHALLGQGDCLAEVINLSKAIESLAPQEFPDLPDHEICCGISAYDRHEGIESGAVQEVL